MTGTRGGRCAVLAARRSTGAGSAGSAGTAGTVGSAGPAGPAGTVVSTGALASAAAQTAAAVTAHTAAAGCLPGTGTLVLALPAAIALVLLLLRLAPDRPLQQLAGAQLSVHALLALSACAGHGQAATGGSHHVVMTFAHVAALVLCRAGLGAVVRAAEHAVARLRSCLRPVPAAVLQVPSVSRATTVRRTVRRRSAKVHRRAPRRGPPVSGLLPLA